MSTCPVEIAHCVPSTEDDLTEQHAQLDFLEGENLQATLKLEQTTELAEYLLEQVQTCLQSLSQALLDERKKFNAHKICLNNQSRMIFHSDIKHYYLFLYKEIYNIGWE
jgi:hypothetical protein